MTKRATPRVKRHAVGEFYRELRRGGKTKNSNLRRLSVRIWCRV